MKRDIKESFIEFHLDETAITVIDAKADVANLGTLDKKTMS